MSDLLNLINRLSKLDESAQRKVLSVMEESISDIEKPKPPAKKIRPEAFVFMDTYPFYGKTIKLGDIDAMLLSRKEVKDYFEDFCIGEIRPGHTMFSVEDFKKFCEERTVYWTLYHQITVPKHERWYANRHK